MAIYTSEKTPAPPSQKDLILDIVRKTIDGDHPEELWDQTVQLARDENKLGKVKSNYPDVDIEEFISLGEKVQNLNSGESKYRLMMEKTKSGKLWYDVLMGDANKLMFVPVESVVRRKFKNTNTKWTRAADIGTGTGNTLRSIAPYCEKVFGVDLTGFSLKTAKTLGLPDNATLIQGRADELPFADKSLDLVVSNGLIYYLSEADTLKFIRELKRILKPGGKFYKSDIIREKNEILPMILAEHLGTAKDALVNLTERLVNGGGHPESLGITDFNNLMLKNGFAVTNNNLDADNRFLIEYTRI